MPAPDTKTLCYGLSTLALAGVLLGACGSPRPLEPVATAPSAEYATPNLPPAPTTATTTIVTTYSSEATAPTAPPPPRAEVIPPSPGPQMVWEQGYWSFNGATWDWIPGHYAARPQPTAQWMPGHWAQQPGGTWVWVAGRWTS